MRVLVTGTQGQLARSLLERSVLHPDLELVAVGRPQLDLEEPGSATRIIAQAEPDLVINAAAYTAVDRAEEEPERAFRINAEAAGEIAAAAARVGARIIQLSTDYVFDGRSAGALTEQAPTGPLNVYGASKVAGEAAVEAANPEHLIVRAGWLYSPFGRNFVKTIMAAAKARKSLTVVDDQFGSPTSALDLADALFAIVERSAGNPAPAFGRTYHVAGSGSTSWFGFAQAIMGELGRRGLATVDVLPIPSAQWPAKALRPRNSVLDSTTFAKEFGYVAPPWEQSLARVVDRLAGASGS
jgi:dTDP-4-dehydrorhamnose reductase